MELGAYLLLVAGVAIRLWLLDTDVSQWLSDRNEISTPITSWRRFTEGLTLLRAGISPYSGDVYHEMPLVLAFWDQADRLLGTSTKYLFIAIDVVIGIALYAVSTNFATYTLNRQSVESKNYHPSSKKLIIYADDLKVSRLYVLAAYMLSPLSIASFVTRNTGLLNNLSIVLSFYATVTNNRFGVSIFTALATYLSLYPAVLIIPFALFLAQKDTKGSKNSGCLFISSFSQTVVCFSSVVGILLYSSYLLEGDWSFLRSTFGFILGAPDHSPNNGIFWYFFTELFDHFKLFFLCVFQIHAFLYVLPLSCRLVDDSFFSAFIVLAFISIFKSYPSYGDMSLWVSLAFLWYHIFKHMRNSFICIIMLITSIVLGPVFWHLWLLAGNANANFYFASTLAVTSAQVFIVFDLLFAYLKRTFELRSGSNLVGPDGEPVKYLLD